MGVGVLQARERFKAQVLDTWLAGPLCLEKDWVGGDHAERAPEAWLWT